MKTPYKRRHLFISHHHQDDSLVEKFNSLLGGKGWDVRNSSIRAKPANRERLKNGLVKDAVLKRLLRMKISWASTVVVLIGEKTHSRPWVNWEIDQAHAQGKTIVGVFEQGGKDADIPKGLEKYASAIVGWNASSIQRAIDNNERFFESANGSVRQPLNGSARTSC
jgi:hypothetical protein